MEVYRPFNNFLLQERLRTAADTISLFTEHFPREEEEDREQETTAAGDKGEQTGGGTCTHHWN